MQDFGLPPCPLHTHTHTPRDPQAHLEKNISQTGGVPFSCVTLRVGLLSMDGVVFSEMCCTHARVHAYPVVLSKERIVLESERFAFAPWENRQLLSPAAFRAVGFLGWGRDTPPPRAPGAKLCFLAMKRNGGKKIKIKGREIPTRIQVELSPS